MALVSVSDSIMAASLTQATADAQAGNAAAQYALSQYFLARRDEQQALHWLQRAAEQGLVEACYSLAQWRLSGLSSENELRQAHALLCQAADSGLLPAQLTAAKTELMLAGPLADRKAAARSRLEQAAASGDATAKRQLAMWSSDETRKQLLQQAAGSGDPIAAELLTQNQDTSSSYSVPTELPETDGRILDFGASASPLECAYVIALARELLRPSFVIDPQSGQRRPHPIRRSEGAVLDYFSMDAVCFELVRRLCDRLAIDWQRCEPINVLRYHVGDEYRLHHDAFEHDPLAHTRGKSESINQRSHTSLLYLNAVTAGGETSFPRLQQLLKPAPGQMYCFTNLRDEKPDPDMLHAGCPVTAGEKWLMTLWLRQRPLLQH